MTPRRVLAGGTLVALVVAAGVFGWRRVVGAEASLAPPAIGWSDVQIRERLDRDPRSLELMLRTLPVSDAEVDAWVFDHRDTLPCGRVERCRDAIVDLVRIDRVRRAVGR